jgi:uncharacterized membrane protein
MDSRAKIAGHSIHQILIVFPLGLLATAVVFDAVYLATANEAMRVVAYWMLVAGILGGLVAAPFGTIDWLAIPTGTRARRVGLYHGLTMVAAIVLFAGSWWMRYSTPDRPAPSAYVLSYVGAVVAVIGGWLGGELVARLGVGVYDGAHLDSPNSLSGRPASEHVSSAPSIRSA